MTRKLPRRQQKVERITIAYLHGEGKLAHIGSDGRMSGSAGKESEASQIREPPTDGLKEMRVIKQRVTKVHLHGEILDSWQRGIILRRQNKWNRVAGEAEKLDFSEIRKGIKMLKYGRVQWNLCKEMIGLVKTDLGKKLTE